MKTITYIDKESPMMSYQRKLTFNFSNFNLGLLKLPRLCGHKRRPCPQEMLQEWVHRQRGE